MNKEVVREMLLNINKRELEYLKSIIQDPPMIVDQVRPYATISGLDRKGADFQTYNDPPRGRRYLLIYRDLLPELRCLWVFCY